MPTKLTANGGHSDDLRAGRVLFLDNSQRDGGSVCLPDLFTVQTQLREKKKKEQIDAELLTDSYYPNRRMMMGIICCATQLQRGSRLQATPVTHFLIFHSRSHGLLTAMETE